MNKSSINQNSVLTKTITSFSSKTGKQTVEDILVNERPLNIRIKSNKAWFLLTMTMRTPGDDENLAKGLLFAEGIVAHKNQIQTTSYQAFEAYDQIDVQLSKDIIITPELFQRDGIANAACGLCGRLSMDFLERINYFYPTKNKPFISPETLLSLSQQLQQTQTLFTQTGGIHAAALFSFNGKLLAMAEDIGRHNAVDKLLGKALSENKLPWRDHIVLVSGRAGFELVQKCAMAGTACMAAIGAPSSLAMEIADQSGMTLIGFLRDQRFNIYTHPERVQL